jgi:hypothetical protein
MELCYCSTGNAAKRCCQEKYYLIRFLAGEFAFFSLDLVPVLPLKKARMLRAKHVGPFGNDKNNNNKYITGGQWWEAMSMIKYFMTS